jgi:membrane-associated protein
MEFLVKCWELIRELDVHLESLIRDYQWSTYLILAGIVFCETGLVVTPFLPGDSLLFAAGAVTGKIGILDIRLLILVLMAASILGDNVNYFLGHRLGRKVFERDYWFIRRAYLDRTQDFFLKHGGKTIVLARFIPIVRTFAPFVAGVGAMPYSRFIGFCLLASAIWVPAFTLTGFYFGQLPFVRQHFEWIIVAIIAVSLAPVGFEWWRARHRRFESKTAEAPGAAD